MPTERDDNPLRTALQKRDQGRGMKASEAALIRAAEKVQVFPRKPRPEPHSISEGDTRTTMLAGKDTLASAAGGGAGAADLAALEARIAALETYKTVTLDPLLSGLSRQTVTYCSGGSSSSKTILMG